MPRPAGTGQLSEAPEPGVPAARASASSWLWTAPLLTLVIGLAVTVTLALVSESQYKSNEKRLITLRVRDAGQLLASAFTAIQTPLTSTAELADATGGSVAKFRRFVAPYAGAPPTHQFVSMSLWRAADLSAGPVAVAGVPPLLASTPAQAQAFLGRA
ncbi:MAG: hypothetical protein WBQ18_10475, partial [Solirubrobacteraceae bacterium]